MKQKWKKLFETNANNVTNLNAENVFTDVPFIQYEQIKLDNSFRTYLESNLLSENVLRTGIQKIPYQKIHEINTGNQSHAIGFLGANK